MEHVSFSMHARSFMTDQAYSPSASIAALVASVDEHFAQYPAILRMRKSKVEVFKFLFSLKVTI